MMCNHPKQEADDDKALERIQKLKAEDGRGDIDTAHGTGSRQLSTPDRILIYLLALWRHVVS